MTIGYWIVINKISFQQITLCLYLSFYQSDGKQPVEQLRNVDEVSNRAIVTLDKAEVSNEYNFQNQKQSQLVTTNELDFSSLDLFMV